MPGIGLGAVEEKKAEEVFEPAGRLEERVPFQIEDHVAGRARRKGGEAAARLDGEGSPLQGARALPDQLKPRLIAQATECGGGHLGDGGPGRASASAVSVLIPLANSRFTWSR